MKTMEWHNLPNKPAKHGWAFYYFLKRQGDRVVILKQNGRTGPLSIRVHRREA